MDLSALIFVALAVAWAVYLIPMALKQHEDAARTRSVDGFGRSLRVLARREPTGSRGAALVVEGDRAEKGVAGTVVVEEAPEAAGPDKISIRRTPASAPAAPRPSAQAVATRRRRRVLLAVVLANVAVVALASAAVVAWAWTAATVGLLVAWLVACRVMVKGERRAAERRPVARRAPARATDADAPSVPVDAEAALDDGGPATEDMPAVAAHETADPADPAGWDPRPVQLPTYVGKAQADRSVRTIDLDSTGVWSSGRNADDSELARGAEEAERAAKADRDAAARRRATGS